ncbi:MAG: mannosyltransferase family protein [Bacilli bacterium]|nr:mannosyltransferase family protein [Bacilli bacterium]
MIKIKDKKEKMFWGLRIFLLIVIAIFGMIRHDFDFLKYYDAQCYLEIAKNGYSMENLYAFFPLFPLLIKLFSFVFRSYIISGLLINFICSIINYYIIEKLVDDKNRLWLYIFSPIVIFFSIIYTESLFLMLTLLSFYYYKKEKKIVSSLFIGLSIVTRNTGAILFFAMLIDYFYNIYKNKKINYKELFLFIMIPIGIGSLYPLYLYYRMDNLLYFVDVQYIFWGRESLFFVIGFINDIKFIITTGFSLFEVYLVGLNWIFTIYGFYLCIKIFKKDRISSIYGILSIIVFVSSFRDIVYWKTIASISLFRYVLGLYPIYLYSDLMKNKCVAFVVRIVCLCNIFLYMLGLFIG